jgi:hypothetical protein
VAVSGATRFYVRRLLGDPETANDVSQFTEPYPGDALAKHPVFTHKMHALNEEWGVLIYFAKYCFHTHSKQVPGDSICSIDLVPVDRLVFDLKELPPIFKKRHVQAVDGAWDEYSDGRGLRYDVYTMSTPYGGHLPGDLDRISYGPPNSVTDKSEHDPY